MGNPNQTTFLEYAAWPFAMFAIMVAVGIAKHSHFTAYAVGCALLFGGIGVMIWQIKNDGDTTKTPYLLQFIGLGAFLLITYLS